MIHLKESIRHLTESRILICRRFQFEANLRKDANGKMTPLNSTFRYRLHVKQITLCQNNNLLIKNSVRSTVIELILNAEFMQDAILCRFSARKTPPTKNGFFAINFFFKFITESILISNYKDSLLSWSVQLLNENINCKEFLF